MREWHAEALARFNLHSRHERLILTMKAPDDLVSLLHPLRSMRIRAFFRTTVLDISEQQLRIRRERAALDTKYYNLSSLLSSVKSCLSLNQADLFQFVLIRRGRSHCTQSTVLADHLAR